MAHYTHRAVDGDDDIHDEQSFHLCVDNDLQPNHGAVECTLTKVVADRKKTDSTSSFVLAACLF
jgi:hypothetical protein